MYLTTESLEKITKCGVYGIYHKASGKKYIGSTSTWFGDRWRRHFRDLEKNAHCNRYLQRAWEKYTSTEFEFRILEILEINSIEDAEKLLTIEQQWIEKENADFNLCKVGRNRKGLKASPETLLKMSLANKGKKRQPLSEEHKKRISLANTNKKHSEETKKRMSLGKQGNSNRATKKYELISPTGEHFIVDNMSKFCKINNLESRNMFAVIRGNRKNVKGWTATRLV